METLERCPYCAGSLYTLGDGMCKCSHCRKKISPRRHEKMHTLITAFCQDENAYQCAGRLKYSYASVLQHFEHFRRLAALICEGEYEQVRHRECEYEEYFYLERSKRAQKNAIFDAHNFLTFDYGGHLYTLVMPSLHTYQGDDELREAGRIKEFERFKRQSRIIKIASHQNNIVHFWDFFETSILQYKGISNELFPLYLKEMEFKFNHPADRRSELLESSYYKARA